MYYDRWRHPPNDQLRLCTVSSRPNRDRHRKWPKCQYPFVANPFPFLIFAIMEQTSTVPSYHAELSSAAKRGALILIEGSLITFGVMVSWVLVALINISNSCLYQICKLSYPSNDATIIDGMCSVGRFCPVRWLLSMPPHSWLAHSFGANGSSAQWRVPIALQIIFALVMVFGIRYASRLSNYSHLRTSQLTWLFSFLNHRDGAYVKSSGWHSWQHWLGS